MLKEYKVSQGETIGDIANRTYGNLNYIYKIIQDNPFITGVDFDFSSNPGSVIIWDNSFIISEPPELKQATSASASTIGQYKAINGQGLFDICLQVYGTLDLLYKLIADNGIDNVNITDLAQKVFIFDTTLIQNSALLKKNNIENVIYATQISDQGSFNLDFDSSFG